MRTKKTIINFLSDSIPQILIMILGFIKIKIFLDFLGEEQLGLYQLYNQIIAYLVLVEGGVGSALLFRLYKPIKDKDTDQINRVMSAAKTIYNVVGAIVVIIGLFLSFNIAFFVNGNTFDNNYLQLTFILFLISQVINYFTIPYKMMFDAEQNRYVPNTIFQTTTLIKSILEIIVVMTLPGNKFIWVLILLIIAGIISNVLLIIFFKKKYSQVNFKTEKDFSMLKDVKHLFVNTLGTVVVNNIDIILISKFIGLKEVIVYTSYNYFVEAIKQLIDKITGATMSGIGDLLVTDKKHAYKVFNEFNSFVFFIALVICVPFGLIINQFIDIWYESKILTSSVLALLFTLILLYQIIRIPLKVFTISSGYFKQIKKYTILEIIINITLSLILLKYFGIAGVLTATLISLISAEYFGKPRIIFKDLFEEPVWKYYLTNLGNLTFILIAFIIFYIIFPNTFTNIITCILFGIIEFICIVIIALIYFKITKQDSFIERFNLNKLLKRGGKNGNS